MWKEENRMLSEIGSNFWLSPDAKKESGIDVSIFNVSYEDSVFTSSGRGAVSLILSEQKSHSRRALLPSFTCESVIEPFVRKGYDVEYYSVGESLVVSEERFTAEVKLSRPDVILVHNYFGFDTASGISEILSDLMSEGITVIEDITQSLYSSFCRLPADYLTGSFRKWAGIPDGGFALKSKGKFGNRPDKEDCRLTEAKKTAMEAKYAYLFNGIGNKEDFLKKYAEAESLLENEEAVYGMSGFSVLQQANLDVRFLRERRRSNYLKLANEVGKVVRPLFTVLPDDVVPLYFPVLCGGRRKELQSLLRSNCIYAPVVWPKPPVITSSMEKADCFYNDLLCIPCDQRYGRDEMEKIVSVIDEWSKM